MCLPKDWSPALEANRMLILSPFTEKRADVRTIAHRNHFVAALSDEFHVPYASSGGNLGRFEIPASESPSVAR
ncbi:MAG: hypothetical protein K9M54_01830 [Kiritimatiellales bacterium]|nr:hypothetical protein [Kiritimatiellales bacterium]MCF7864007.1 hypothetical protein [Kiritimatiellales bacterium]